MIAVRAYDAVAKNVRRQTILDAAATLYTKHQSLPTASAIAAASNLANRYFDSREDIFTTLVLDWWSIVLDELEKHLRIAGSAHETRQVFPAHFCRLIIERPLLMQLDAVLPDLKSTMSHTSRESFYNAPVVQVGRCRYDQALAVAGYCPAWSEMRREQPVRLPYAMRTYSFRLVQDVRSSQKVFRIADTPYSKLNYRIAPKLGQGSQSQFNEYSVLYGLFMNVDSPDGRSAFLSSQMKANSLP